MDNNHENMEDLIGKLNNFAKDNNISQDNINNLFNMLNNNINNTNTQNSNSENTYSQENINNFNNIDMETIIKMKNIIEKMNNKNDPRSNLLKSLKPYLNDTRKDKVDQYIELLNMSKAMDIFPFMNGGIKNDK